MISYTGLRCPPYPQMLQQIQGHLNLEGELAGGPVPSLSLAAGEAPTKNQLREISSTIHKTNVLATMLFWGLGFNFGISMSWRGSDGGEQIAIDQQVTFIEFLFAAGGVIALFGEEFFFVFA